jgi:hypothetical protein
METALQYLLPKLACVLAKASVLRAIAASYKQRGARPIPVYHGHQRASTATLPVQHSV